MPIASIDGVQVNRAVYGEGSRLLMLAPDGFDSTIESWWTRGVWKQLRPLDALSARTLRQLVLGSEFPALMPPRQNAETVKRWTLGSVAAAKIRRGTV